MSGRFRPVTFEPYGRRRSRWLVPRWLLLLLAGLATGAAAVMLVQERYLPPRLSVDASAALQASLDRAEAERRRLAGERDAAVKRLDEALAENSRLGDELAADRGNVERLREDIASLIAALPPDPRGGAVEVRAARLRVEGGALAYDVFLSLGRAGSKPLDGVMQFVVAGESARGALNTITLRPVVVSIGSHEFLRGSVPLPDGFKPRQATIQVLDAPDGKRLGMRVINVQQQ